MTRRTMQQVARLGGLALKRKPAPAHPCDCCGKTFTTWLGYIGHKGMRQLAINHFGGDVSAAARQLAWNSLAAAERGASWSNGAWTRKYKPIKAARLVQLEDDLTHSQLMAAHGATEAQRHAAAASIVLIQTELAKLRGN